MASVFPLPSSGVHSGLCAQHYIYAWTHSWAGGGSAPSIEQSSGASHIRLVQSRSKLSVDPQVTTQSEITRWGCILIREEAPAGFDSLLLRGNRHVRPTTATWKGVHGVEIWSLCAKCTKNHKVENLLTKFLISNGKVQVNHYPREE